MSLNKEESYELNELEGGRENAFNSKILKVRT